MNTLTLKVLREITFTHKGLLVIEPPQKITLIQLDMPLKFWCRTGSLFTIWKYEAPETTDSIWVDICGGIHGAREIRYYMEHGILGTALYSRSAKLPRPK